MNIKLEIEVLCDVVSELFDDLADQHYKHLDTIDLLKEHHAAEVQALQNAKKKMELESLEWRLRADEKTSQYNYWRNLAIKTGNLSEFDVVRHSLAECQQRQ